MQALRPVTVDLATGVVTLGGTQLTLERDGERYVAPGDGLLVRALTFEERSSVVAGALIDPEPNRALLTKLRQSRKCFRQTTAIELRTPLCWPWPEAVKRPRRLRNVRAQPAAMPNLDWQSVQQTAAVLVDQLAEATDAPVSRRRMDPLRVQRSAAESASR